MRKAKGPGLGVAGALLGTAWSLGSWRPLERVVSHEGLDDPEIVQEFNRVASMPPMRMMRRSIARRAVELMPRGNAVDLGCGPGHLVIRLAQMAPELHVAGVDLSEEMLAVAERRGRRAGLGDRISFRLGDAAQIPFSAGSLDLVVSTLSLHHWRDPVAVLDEMDRALRPGGAFLVFDLRRDLAPPFCLLLWYGTNFVVSPALRRAREPLASREAAFTPGEAVQLASQSQLGGWRVTGGPLWLTIEGVKP